MKKLFIVFFVSLICFIQAKEFNYIYDENGNKTNLINANPDLKGEPWIVGGTIMPTEKDISSLNELKLPDHILNRLLPEKVDNSKKDAFPKIFSQKGGSCAHASSISYTFAYEINSQRGVSGKTSENEYPYGYTYNFCNSGSSSRGSMPSKANAIVKANGNPNINDYGGTLHGGDGSYWMDGYEEYYNGMKNKIKDYFTIKTKDEEELNVLKQWFYDHGGKEDFGACVTFACNFSGRSQKKLPSSSPEAGYAVVTKWGTGGGHSMTFAGYHDNIEYDINGDGEITTDKDINRDGEVNLKDWERGGVLLVNSHGSRYGTDGRAYVMYSLLAKKSSNGGIWSNVVYAIETIKEYKPKLAYKITLTTRDRNDLTITAGISNNLSATSPSKTKSYAKAFKESGGNYPMEGRSEDSTLQFGLDVTELLEHAQGDESKFFLKISSSSSKGRIKSFSIMDYTGDEVKEIKCDDSDVRIKQGTNYLTINRENSAVDIKQVVTNNKNSNFIVSPSTVKANKSVNFIVKSNKYTTGRITVHNLSGKLVYSKDVSLKSKCTVNWNLNDNVGNLVSNNVYIVQATLNDDSNSDVFSQTRRLVVIK